MLTCDHCALPVSEEEAVYAEFGGERKVFCCHACLGVYGLIHDEGLDAFYESRRGWAPGPVEAKKFDVSPFLESQRTVGSEIEADVIVDGIRCASCVWLNEKLLEQTEGVAFARVNYATHRARIRWDPQRVDMQGILSRISSIGYTPKPYIPSAFEGEQKRQARDMLIRFGTAAFFSMQLMLFAVALYAGFFQGMDRGLKMIFQIISLVLTTPVLFYSGWPLIKGSIRGLVNRAFTMDVLIVAGAISAYGYSIYQIAVGGEVYFDSVAMIITLILLGRYIERIAKNKASDAINQLVQLSPREARRLAIDPAAEGGTSVEDRAGILTAERLMAPIEAIRTGDLLEVIPGEKIPLDGVLIAGGSEADESMLTGESRPASKAPGSPVFGGTVNLNGSFIFRVTKTGADTVLAGIIKAVEDAQARRAPIQAMADRVVGLFVPVVLGIAALTFLGWLLFGAPISTALLNAVSVLVIACPCALGLATPLALLVGTSHAASLGILIKGGDIVEKGSRIDYVVFDKTGTLTEGRPTVTFFRAFELPEREVLRLAFSLERLSEHSLAKAVVDSARGFEPLEVSDFLATPGSGIEGAILGKKLRIGTKSFIDVPENSGSANIVRNLLPVELPLREIQDLESSGASVFYMSLEGRIVGIFGVSDRPRAEAAEAISALRRGRLGVAMITGDNARTARSIAERLGITEVFAETSPAGKAAEVRRIEGGGKKVLMAGDGINDAPALVEATIGMALGRATDVALESADIVVLRPDMRLVLRAVAIMKKTFVIIRQNVFWAFFYNIVAIPLAMLGVLHPIVAAAAMAASSLTVVTNSLRARRS
ncbi:MAG TPA: heavy metal translocating P-type ATPase [Rectinemataceae bacterium]|nr:heavy metal translocating P-type ATPase [Rectinemataceae bacterium]